MRADEAARGARDHVAVPWDDLRAARVQKRVLAALQEGTTPTPARPALRFALALAGAAALVCALLFFALGDRRPRGRLEFADGSSVAVEAGGRVVPESIAPNRIEVRHTEGAAAYEVTPRSERTFVVWVGDVRVEVLGTSFEIDKLRGSVRVAVSRGRVRVSRGARSVVLGAGEEVVFADEPVSEPPAPSSATAEVADPPPTVTTASPPLPEPSGAIGAEATAAELFRQADDARAAGRAADALRLLHLLVERHPKDGRVTLAVFTIGRIESQRGNHGAAASAFESCGSALSGEALAEAALARAALGQSGKAHALARTYLSRFPNGARVKEMERLAP